MKEFLNLEAKNPVKLFFEKTEFGNFSSHLLQIQRAGYLLINDHFIWCFVNRKQNITCFAGHLLDRHQASSNAFPT